MRRTAGALAALCTLVDSVRDDISGRCVSSPVGESKSSDFMSVWHAQTEVRIAASCHSHSLSRGDYRSKSASPQPDIHE